MILRELEVVLDAGRLMAGGDAPIDPVDLVEGLAGSGHLFSGQNGRNMNEHRLRAREGAVAVEHIMCASVGMSGAAVWLEWSSADGSRP